MKASARYVHVEFEEDYAFEVELSAEAITITGELDDARSRKLSKALELLTARQREAVFLRFYEGFSYEEIGMMMDITTKATYKLMARSVEAMRMALGGDSVGLYFIVFGLAKRAIQLDN